MLEVPQFLSVEGGQHEVWRLVLLVGGFLLLGDVVVGVHQVGQSNEIVAAEQVLEHFLRAVAVHKVLAQEKVILLGVELVEDADVQLVK